MRRRAGLADLNEARREMFPALSGPLPGGALSTRSRADARRIVAVAAAAAPPLRVRPPSIAVQAFDRRGQRGLFEQQADEAFALRRREQRALSLQLPDHFLLLFVL